MTEGRTMLLHELTRQNITWSCPLHLNADKLKFLDVRKRKVKNSAVPIDCERQYPIYLKHGKRYYEIDEAGITEASNVTIKVNGGYYGDKQLKTRKLSALLETHWEENLPPMDIYNTLSDSVIQARQNAYDRRRTRFLDEVRYTEKRDIQSLRNSVKTLSKKESRDWITTLAKIRMINDTFNDFYESTETKFEQVTDD